MRLTRVGLFAGGFRELLPVEDLEVGGGLERRGQVASASRTSTEFGT